MKTFQHSQRRKLIAVILIAGLMLGLTFFPGRSAGAGTLEVSFINVGQGDSALLRDAYGFDVLIDGGRSSAGPAVVDYLRAQGVDDIDVLVASHADADHIGGLIDVLALNDIPVEAVVYNGYAGTTQTWINFMAAVAAEGLTPTAAQFPGAFQWGEMSVQVLNPPAGLANPDTNDASLVLRVDFGDFNVLFTGDIDAGVEAAVVARGTPLAVEVLKVAHHGSSYSSSDAFLAAADPADSVISVGENSYGHPAADALQRLEASGAAVWRTDRNGNVLVVSDGVTYTISAEFIATIEQLLYLPAVMKLTPEPGTATPVPTTGNVRILSVFANGAGNMEPDEYVAIQNQDSRAVQVQGWTLRDIADHVYTFPDFVMAAGQVCRVYTNQTHPEWCGFNYESGSAIWNNTGDCAYLRNAQGAAVDSYCY